MFPFASIPDPAEPTFIAFGAAIGAFAGRAVARRRGYNADNRMHWTVEGSFYGTGIALGAYLVANALKAGLS
jgi:hypothetical protein